MSTCMVWKVKDKFSTTSTPVGIWIGWCNDCDQRTAQYWDFGAALGATLYHIHITHQED